MIGVIVPAHDEEALIGRALRALLQAAAHEALAGEEVQILVVLDGCSDRSGEVARGLGVECLAIDVRNVGLARAAGAQVLIARGARWLAFTDADSRVAASWLSRQVSLRSDAVCGVVEVDDWTSFTEAQRRDYEAGYRDAEGHSHVHGANLGLCSLAYQRAGGFPPLACHEDVAMIRRLQAIGATIAWTNSVRVATSARRVGRVSGGFSSLMERLDHCDATLDNAGGDALVPLAK